MKVPMMFSSHVSLVLTSSSMMVVKIKSFSLRSDFVGMMTQVFGDIAQHNW